jgi:hypothetical protein
MSEKARTGSAAHPDPAIKGSVLKTIVERVHEVCGAKKVSAAELERRLGIDGLQCLNGEILAASWYPIRFYGAVRELLRDVEGGGKERYSIDSAAEVARKLIASGMYPQLDYLKQWKEHVPLADPLADAAARRELFEQQLARVCRIYNSLFNFSTTKVTRDPNFSDRLQLEYWDHGVMPRDGRLAVLGFWLAMSEHWSPRHRGELWTKTDFTDHYILRMSRDIAEM